MEKVNSLEGLESNSLFNSLTEIGMRILFILEAFHPCTIDLKYLSAYDYYILHTEDIDGPKSLHVATASRSGEFLVRRKGIQRALLFLQRAHLIELHNDADGQAYKITEEATGLLDVVAAPYHEKLKHRAAWLYERHMYEPLDFEEWMLDKLSEMNANPQSGPKNQEM
ncbi:ABC-three component system middle component 2 [Bordetella tumulicola]|uniref:ABC-three component system middle component 2 n=1 Tax=Bordetella tumulicola TaxID=1649133 RepID=UPI0039F034A3